MATLSCPIQKILVVNPPLLLERNFIDYPYFANLGAVQHAAVLEKSGFETTVADAFALEQSDAFPVEDQRFIVGCTPETLVDSIGKNVFDAAVVCLSVFHRPFLKHAFTLKFLELFKSRFPDTPLAAADAYFGGMHYVDYSDADFFQNYSQADALFRYESELAVLHWAKSGCRQEAPSPAQYGAVPLEKLPPPAWDLINVQNYFGFLSRFFESAGQTNEYASFFPCLPAVASRGCMFSCSFCSGTSETMESKYRRYSLEFLEEYIGGLKAKYGVKGLAFLDGLANAAPEPFERFLETVESHGLKALFVNGLRADRLTEAHIQRLGRISPSITVSAECGSDRVRNDVLNKKLDLKSIEYVAEMCKKAAVPLRVHYMIGVPGETVEEVNATLGHAQRLADRYGASPLIQYCAPLPGAALYDQLAADGGGSHLADDNYFEHFWKAPAAPGERLPAESLIKMKALFEGRLKENSPEKLIVNLTYRCNNECAFCAIADRPKRHADFEDCVELLKRHSAQGIFMVDFDGGEPTLHPNLFHLIGIAREIGYRSISVTSNGRRLASRDFASRFLLSGIDNVLISLYGPDAETHEEITRAPRSFEETLKGIRHVVRLKPDRVSFGVNTVATASNYQTIGALADFVADLGVRALNVQFPTPFGRANGGHVPPVDKTCEIVEAAKARHGENLQIQAINLPPCQTPSAGGVDNSDAEKYARKMAFVDAPPESLATFLAGKRRRKEECAGCIHYIVCEGFYIFDP